MPITSDLPQIYLRFTSKLFYLRNQYKTFLQQGVFLPMYQITLFSLSNARLDRSGHENYTMYNTDSITTKTEETNQHNDILTCSLHRNRMFFVRYW